MSKGEEEYLEKGITKYKERGCLSNHRRLLVGICRKGV